MSRIQRISRNPIQGGVPPPSHQIISSFQTSRGLGAILTRDGHQAQDMTEGHLNQRMPSTNTIGMNQSYVLKVLGNPRTPRANREAVISYVLNNPEKFTPVAYSTGDPTQDEWAAKHNGSNARHGFMKEFRRRYSNNGGL